MKRCFIWIAILAVLFSGTVSGVELEAVQFGGKGFGMLYDPNTRCIPVDEIYITSDLGEQTGPDLAGFHVVDQGRDTPVELVSQKDAFRAHDNMATPAPEQPPVIYPIRLQACEGRRNLCPMVPLNLAAGTGGPTRTPA